MEPTCISCTSSERHISITISARFQLTLRPAGRRDSLVRYCRLVATLVSRVSLQASRLAGEAFSPPQVLPPGIYTSIGKRCYCTALHSGFSSYKCVTALPGLKGRYTNIDGVTCFNVTVKLEMSLTVPFLQEKTSIMLFLVPDNSANFKTFSSIGADVGAYIASRCTCYSQKQLSM